MKEKLMRFMSGRYGVDSLGKFALIAGVIIVVLAGLFDSTVFYFLAWGLIILSYFRMFSKNIYKRSGENQKFLNKTYKIRCWFAKQKNISAQKKIYHIYKCPTCKQKIRVPKGKGKIEVRCPKCSTHFVKNS